MKKGFTILELLVVIVIIGIIASMTFVALNGVRAKARDAKRISDIRQVQSALEIYKNDNGVYPPAGSVVSGQPLVANGQTYMTKVPSSPNVPDGSCSSDTYSYGTSDQTNYTLNFCLGGAVNSAGPAACEARPGNPCYIFQCGTDTVTYDGKTYNTVLIGTQCWFKENLAYLPSVIGPNAQWPSTSVAKYSVNEYTSANNSVDEAKSMSNYNTYGVLYNWVAASTACPSGWRLPTDSEFKLLEIYLGMTQAQADGTTWRGNHLEGRKLRAWSDGTNAVLFTALAAGYRDATGAQGTPGSWAFFWTSTQEVGNTAYERYLTAPGDQIWRVNQNKAYGMSIRCIKN